MFVFDGVLQESAEQDSMHNVYLGVGRDVAGSCLELLTSIKFFGDVDLEGQLKLAHKAMRKYFRDRRIKCGLN